MVTGIKVEQQSDDVRVPQPLVHVQFVTATVRQSSPFDGHRASRATAAATAQHRPVNGAERAGVQRCDVRDSEPVVRGCCGAAHCRHRSRSDVVVARPWHV